MAPITIVGARTGAGAATRFGTSTATAGIIIRVTVDNRSINLAYKRLVPYKYQYFNKQARRIWYEAARIPEKKMQRSIPVMSGNLRKSIRARQNRLQVKEMAAATVGPRKSAKSRHRHLYILGTTPHKLAGGSSGRSGKSQYSAFPYRGKKYNLKLTDSMPGPMRRGERNTGKVYLAYNPWLKHPGAQPNGQLDMVWNSNKPKIQSFINTSLQALGQRGINTGMT